VREASARDGVGGELHRGPDQRDLPAADILPAVPPLSALLPAQYGSVQGQVAGCPGECRQASLAANPDHVDQCPLPGGAVRAPPYHIRYHKDPLDFWWLRGAVPPLGFHFLFAFLFFTEFFFRTKDKGSVGSLRRLGWDLKKESSEIVTQILFDISLDRNLSLGAFEKYTPLTEFPIIRAYLVLSI